MALKQILQIAHMRSTLFVPKDIRRSLLWNSDGEIITIMKSIRRPHFQCAHKACI